MADIDKILNPKKIRYPDIDTGEKVIWEGRVCVCLDYQSNTRFSATIMASPKLHQSYDPPRYVFLVLVNAEGEKYFTTVQHKNLEMVQGLFGEDETIDES
ncbi:hypothetical protein KAR91_84055 [Candidatus Pacearchaeota archaeon]|nr:hypothetical protein [Candidatus Pacearchaeota archaeon]